MIVFLRQIHDAQTKKSTQRVDFLFFEKNFSKKFFTKTAKAAFQCTFSKYAVRIPVLQKRYSKTKFKLKICKKIFLQKRKTLQKMQICNKIICIFVRFFEGFLKKQQKKLQKVLDTQFFLYYYVSVIKRQACLHNTAHNFPPYHKRAGLRRYS